MSRAILRPRSISIALAIALAVQAAVTVEDLVSEAAWHPDVLSTHHIRKTNASGSPLTTIVTAHLFGVAPTAARDENDDGAAVVSSAPLVLTGTIAAADPARGFAIIGTDASSARMHSAGTSVSDGIVLRAVYIDHALIDRAGRLESIWLPRSSLMPAVMPRIAEVADTTTPPPAFPEPTDVRERLDYENTRVGTAFKETPLMSMDQFRGLRVEAGADPGILKQMGLQAGDVVQGVDGILVDLEHVDLLRKALVSGRRVRIGVIRPQEGPMDLEIDAGQFQGLVSN